MRTKLGHRFERTDEMSSPFDRRKRRKRRRPAKVDEINLVIIPKDGTQDFWKTVHLGVCKAAQDFQDQGTPIRFSWKDPGSEEDYRRQVQLLEEARAERVSGIVLGPLDSRCLVPSVNNLIRAKIPVLIIDSALESEKVVSFVASDNFRAGSVAAKYLGQLLNGTGQVILLRQLHNSASTEDRARGFLSTMRCDFPHTEILCATEFAGGTFETAYRTSKYLLKRLGSGANGIFTVNELASAGMLLALQEAGLTRNQVKFVGFDTNQRLLENLRTGAIDGLIVQDPFAIGYLGVKTLVDALQGNLVAPRSITHSRLLTANGVTRRLAAAESAFDPDVSRRPRASLDLTSRETEVLQWVRQGKRDSEIALILGISTRTAEKHVSRILQKLSVETRTAAAMYREFVVPLIGNTP
jgi:ribose transport system substrate-binding protein